VCVCVCVCVRYDGLRTFKLLYNADFNL